MNSLVSCRARGFTLLELLITIALVVVLATLALPGMQSFFDRERLIGATEQVYSHLQQARIEAIARSTNVHVNFKIQNDNFKYGMNQDSGCDLDNPSECYLLVDEGNETVDVNDRVNMVFDVAVYQNIAAELLDANAIDTNSDGVPDNYDFEIAFNSLRGTAEFTPDPGVDVPVEIRFTSDVSDRQLSVTVGPLGQIGVCSPNDTVDGYRKC